MHLRLAALLCATAALLPRADAAPMAGFCCCMQGPANGPAAEGHGGDVKPWKALDSLQALPGVAALPAELEAAGALDLIVAEAQDAFDGLDAAHDGLNATAGLPCSLDQFAPAAAESCTRAEGDVRLFRIVLRPYCRGVLENSYPLAAVDALLTLAADGQVTVEIKQLEFPLEWDVASVSFGSID